MLPQIHVTKCWSNGLPSTSRPDAISVATPDSVWQSRDSHRHEQCAQCHLPHALHWGSCSSLMPSRRQSASDHREPPR